MLDTNQGLIRCVIVEMWRYLPHFKINKRLLRSLSTESVILGDESPHSVGEFFITAIHPSIHHIIIIIA